MKRLLTAVALFTLLPGAAFATANLDCSAKDKNIARLEIEALTSRDGKYLDSLRGEIEIEPGKTIELTKSDVKTHHSQKNISLHLVKRTPQGLIDIRIYAKPVGDGDLDYEGSYVVRFGKINKSGKAACQAG